MRRLLLLTLGAALLAPCVANAKTTTPAPNCSPTTATVFSPFGDLGQYFQAPGGGFESGTTAWTLATGAKTVAGNETFKVAGTGTSALSLPAGSSATSPLICVDPTAPTLRFFLRNTGTSTSTLALDVLYTLSTGKAGSAQIATFTATSTWQPSPITYYYANLLANFTPSGTTNVQFRFRPVDKTGSWQIDDVYVDPFKRCC